MSLDEAAVKAIINCPQAHEPDVRVCAACSDHEERPGDFKRVEFVGGSHWVCGECTTSDDSGRQETTST